jgi:hypothetical protein
MTVYKNIIIQSKSNISLGIAKAILSRLHESGVDINKLASYWDGS